MLDRPNAMFPSTPAFCDRGSDHASPTEVSVGLKLLLVAEGDAETTDCWSGSARAFANALRSKGVTVRSLNVELRGIPRLLGAALTVSPDREVWRQRFILGSRTFAMRSRLARTAVMRAFSAGSPDVLVQIGASFDLGRLPGMVRHVLYADANASMSIQAGPFSEIHRLPRSEHLQLLERERRVYAAVDRIWTFSEYLRASFLSDFGVAPDRVLSIGGGANVQVHTGIAGPSDRASPQRILFVGKQYERKGLTLLLDAFRRVRAHRPEIELHLVGVPESAVNAEGTVAHGVVDSTTSEGEALIADLYRRSTVFCLPSRYEPFGVAFVEAMLSGLPCIGTRSWAMPEIIENGTTGWVIDDGSVDQLAVALETALADPEASLRMGAAGRERALARFTWDRVAEHASADALSLVRSDSFAR